MNVSVTGLPADHPDAEPIQALVERIVELTHDQKASVVLSSLFSLYRHGLMQHPNLHEVAIKHLLQVSDELLALKTGQAAAQPAPAVATETSNIALSLDGLSPEIAAVVESLVGFMNGRWPHHQVLPALFFLYLKTTLAHPCCLAAGVDVLSTGVELLRTRLQSTPEAERAGQPLH